MGQVLQQRTVPSLGMPPPEAATAQQKLKPQSCRLSPSTVQAGLAVPAQQGCQTQPVPSGFPSSHAALLRTGGSPWG